MSDDRYFLIRYTGGSGGDTFCNILNSKIHGSLNQKSRDDHNRAAYDDLFSTEFTHPVSNSSTRAALDLPLMPWYTINDDQVKSVVEYWKLKHPDRRIGKVHFNFSNKIDYRHVFEGFTSIDLMPPVEVAWLNRALHLFKSALRKKTEDHSRFSKIFGPDAEKEFDEHAKLHGWWPEWYVWRGPMPLDQFLEIELREYHLYIQSLPQVLDTRINSNVFTLDKRMPWIEQLKKEVDVDLGDKKIRSYLTPWIRRNNEILDYLGLREHLNKDYDWETKNLILQTKFVAKQDDILNQRGLE